MDFLRDVLESIMLNTLKMKEDNIINSVNKWMELQVIKNFSCIEKKLAKTNKNSEFLFKKFIEEAKSGKWRGSLPKSLDDSYAKFYPITRS